MLGMATHPDYSAPQAHAKLQELSPRLERERIFFREQVRAHESLQSNPLSERYALSDRDRAICGLAAKAVQTHKSIGLLVAADQNSDALSLSRVLLENAFSLSWILQSPDLRIDLYWLSSIAFQRRLAELMLEHFPTNRDETQDAVTLLADKNAGALSKLLDDRWKGWARRDEEGRTIPIGANGIFRDVGVTNPGGKQESFSYDVVYFVHSHHVHSTVESTRGKDGPAERDWFTFRIKRDPRIGQIALTGANVSMIQVLAEMQKYLQTELFEPELTEIWNSMRTLIPAVPTVGAD